MKIGILGSGDVGRALAQAFKGEGHEVMIATREPKGTKGAEGLKKGDKVTVYYTMTATEIENKDAAKKDDKKAEPKKDAKKK